MKIATWNVRGFGDVKKKCMVRKIIREEQLDLIGLTETKHQEINSWEMKQCWGNQEIDWVHVTARQGSGGLILAWRQSYFSRSNSFALPRWVCVIGEFLENNVQGAVCLIYAPTEHHERLTVWDQIRAIKSRFGIPWILMGDFNEVLKPEERRGAKRMTQGMREMQNLILDLQLVDMDVGQKYTWLRKNAASRLDRVLVDQEWVLRWPALRGYCKGRAFSDHYPIVISSFEENNHIVPFRALDVWLDEPSFGKLFEDEWLQYSGLPLEKKLRLIKKPLKRWSREVFGHIDRNIQKFEQALKTAEEAVIRGETGEIAWSRIEALRSQLWLWMIKNERYWKQLSRCRVVKDGDRNTKYFHLTATMRRQRNRIDKLKIDGVEISDMSIIKKSIAEYFQTLYSRQQSTSFDLTQLGFKKISIEEQKQLEKPVTRKEIQDALDSCDPSKAPGYDGFNLKFIKKLWPVIEDDFCAYISRFFETGRLHESFNTTWIVLIPKKKGILEVSEYRPISLVGSLYKLVAKILSRRIKEVMPSIIGETQTAFVSGRQILDGALVANEVIQWLKKRSKAGVLMKMDFQKAYDTVDWDALDKVMEEMGFGCKWRHWIQKCVSSAKVSVVFNGTPLQPIKMQRGLRQGDPLSPFLFVIIAEVLNKMMQKAAETGLIRGLIIGSDKVQLTHLQFADDTLVFCEAEEKIVKTVKAIFLSF